MKKYLFALIAGSAISTAAFAAEPASAPRALSDNEMDVVTAGGYSQPARPVVNNSRQTNNQSQGGTINVGINPTVGANVAILSFGTGGQTVGAYNPQSGGTQNSIIKR